jgi:hypothetical protein
LYHDEEIHERQVFKKNDTLLKLSMLWKLLRAKKTPLINATTKWRPGFAES